MAHHFLFLPRESAVGQRLIVKSLSGLIQQLLPALRALVGSAHQVRDRIDIVKLSGHPDESFLRSGLKQILFESRVADRDMICETLAAFAVQVTMLARPVPDSSEKLFRHFFQCSHGRLLSLV
jgi:hypothetical protein